MQAACTQQRGESLLKQCYAEVQSYLQQQRDEEIAQQRAAAREAAIQKLASSTATTVTSLATGTNIESAEPISAIDSGSGLAPPSPSATSSTRSSTTEYAKAYAVAASPSLSGITDEWVKQKLEGSEHVFSAWSFVDSATAIAELQSSDPADQAKGIGNTTKALLGLHWGVYSPNQLSVEVSERSIDLITNVAGQAFSSLDESMGAALAQISIPASSGNEWDFNRTQAPIGVPYVAVTPASVIILPASNAQNYDEDADIGQFLKILRTPK